MYTFDFIFFRFPGKEHKYGVLGYGYDVYGHCVYISTVGTDLYGCEYFNLSQKM